MTAELWARDVHLAWRGLTRAKGFATAAVLTLALGMAGATSMFALIQNILLRPLPMPESDRLVAIWKELPSAVARRTAEDESSGSTHWPLRAAEVELIREATAVFAGVAAVGYNDPSQFDIIDQEWTDTIRTARVTGDFFDVIGVRPLLGRALTREDDRLGAEPALVITHGLWQRRYGRAADVIGRRLTLGEQRFAIVGVMPPGVEYPRGAEAWMTVEARVTTSRNPTFQIATRNELDAIARLQPGVTLAQAGSALAAMSAQLDDTAPAGAPAGSVAVARRLADVLIGDVRSGMYILFGAVGLVLLIASANVANLLLVRGEIRRPELAVRMALGATRRRLLVQVFAESLLLAATAGAIGLAIAWGSLRTLVALAPGGLPRADAIRVDGIIVLFVAGLAIVTTLLAGIVPALAAARASLIPQLQRSGRAGERGATSGRRALVAAQVALALAVVAAAGLVAQSLIRLQATSVDVGANRLLFVSLALPQERYADRARHMQFLNDVVARLESTPAVESATPINAVPFSGVGWDVPTFTAEGQDATRAAGNGTLSLEAIQPGYFDTFGVKIVRGRSFHVSDREDTPVAIVSEDVAARTWPGQDPIGRRLKMGDLDSPDPWRTVVGVAAPTRYRYLGAPQATLYVPAEQLIVSAQSLAVKSMAPLADVAGAVREHVRAADASVRVSRVVPFTELLREPLARPRFYTVLLGVFALSALLLAAIGLYAVIAASVRQRYGEIGIRLAVGASPAEVRGMIVREAMRLAALGAAVGLALVLGVTRFLQGLLYEVHPLDPATLLGAAALLLAAAAFASYLPARTAAGIDPLVALRSE